VGAVRAHVKDSSTNHVELLTQEPDSYIPNVTL